MLTMTGFLAVVLCLLFFSVYSLHSSLSSPPSSSSPSFFFLSTKQPPHSFNHGGRRQPYDGPLIETPVIATPEIDLLEDIIDSVKVMQDGHFEQWLGTWPSAIDWTAAVIQTILTGTLNTLSDAFNSKELHVSDAAARLKENLVNTYFDHVTATYFGQNYLAIREEAYDDMLWVVLGWLEAVRFVEAHNLRHHRPKSLPTGSVHMAGRLEEMLANTSWHGMTWIPSFSHRARIFWDLANSGWDTKLCGGGMVWNPRVDPYKNAITNQLWIAASSKMFLHFVGDSNTSPYHGRSAVSRPVHDPKHLSAAACGYDWLMNSGMITEQGLFADGFHVSRLREGGTDCDVLYPLIYTYNQGVILSGCRGLFVATGESNYLNDCHKLVESVILRTGWDITLRTPLDSFSPAATATNNDEDTPLRKSTSSTDWLPPWHGIGRVGVLEEQCDSTATCSQDSQTFKGIFFHHLVDFCAPFSDTALLRRRGDQRGDQRGEGVEQTIRMHAQRCRDYAPWVLHNARAAQLSRDRQGRFGMWWTVGLFGWNPHVAKGVQREDVARRTDARAAHDYRSYGLPEHDGNGDYGGLWGLDKGRLAPWTPGRGNATVVQHEDEKNVDDVRLQQQQQQQQQQKQKQKQTQKQKTDDHLTRSSDENYGKQRPLQSGSDDRRRTHRNSRLSETVTEACAADWKMCEDPNDRGLGRTVETQAGGVAVLRAAWVFSNL